MSGATKRTRAPRLPKGPRAAPLLEQWKARGFDVIPVAPHDATGIPEKSRGKIPAKIDGAGIWHPLVGWPTADLPADLLRLCGQAGANVGIRTRQFPAADIDVHDPKDKDIADAAEVVLAEQVGAAPVRTRSNSPGRAILYRLAGEPFPKLILAFTTPSGADAKVELLANGQQIVAAGAHTSGVSLVWRGGTPEAAKLPELNKKKATAALLAVEKRLTDLGCTAFKLTGRGAPPSRAPRAASGDVEDVEAPLFFDPWRVKHALAGAKVDPDAYDAWIGVGQSLHAANPDPSGPGFTTWDEWSRTSPKYDGSCAKRWATFQRDRGRTIAGLFVQAQRDGWTPPTDAEALDSILSRLKEMDDGGCRELYARLAAANGLSGTALLAIEAHARERLGLDDEDVKAGREEAATATDLGLNAARTTLGAALEKMNGQHFVLRTGGDVGVGEIETSPETGKRILTRQSEQDFVRWHKTTRIETERGDVPIANAWLNWRKRRQYRGIVLEPDHSKTPDGYLNLWQGFSVEPEPGDWAILRDHLHEVICSGDDALYEYVLRWFARSVQLPGVPGEVAIVLRGLEGAGKGALLRPWVSLFGAHGLHVTSQKALVGDFNAHLAWVMALFADEALFAGDRSHEGNLKGLITEPTLTVEPKGIDRYEMRNRLKIVMATNHEWAVPAGLQARRYCVADVSPKRLNDWPYFEKLRAAGEDPKVLAAMLHDLRAVDLSTFNVRRVPRTQALDDQKNLSLTGPVAFVRDVLLSGKLPVDRDGGARDLGRWEATGDLYRAFEWWAQRQRFGGHSVPLNIFGRTLTTIFGAPKREPSEHVRIVKGQDAKRSMGYAIGSLAKAREQFAEVTKIGRLFDEVAS